MQIGDNADDHVARFRAGQRVPKPQALFDDVQDIGPHECSDRVIVCNDDRDILECSKCGRQHIARCTFDDDYS